MLWNDESILIWALLLASITPNKDQEQRGKATKAWKHCESNEIVTF
jgi:hypothetical protein